MLKYVLLAALVVCTVAVESDDVHAEVNLLKSDVRADGFDAALETSNHIHQVSSGDEHGNMHGDFSWISPEGVHVEIKYVADENGYQPVGDLIPTPPPIPEAILKAIEYLKTHAPKEEPHH
ncbi:larval cuticle protein 2-like [Cochliomyia hominivorax]